VVAVGLLCIPLALGGWILTLETTREQLSIHLSVVLFVLLCAAIAYFLMERVRTDFGETSSDSLYSTLQQLSQTQEQLSEAASSLAETQNRLRDSDNRCKALLNSLSDGVLLIDANSSLPIMYNDAVCDMLGYTREEFSSLRVLDYDAAHNEQALRRRVKRILRKGRDCFETRHRRKDGGLIDVHVTVETIEMNGRTVFSVILRDISEHKNHAQQLDRLSHYDIATGLPNRQLFRQELDRSLKSRDSRKKLAVLFVDLDRFRVINDTLGHDVGDALLRQVGDRLAECVDGTGTLARMGGDEFAVLLSEVQSEVDVRAAARRVLESLRCTFLVDGHELVTSASIGYSICPAHGTDMETMLMNADAAMYKAKERGRNRYQAYCENTNIVAMENLRIEQDLRKAVEREEFVLFYQPRVELFTSAVTGAEALLRWQHSENGITPPSSFIPIAEETGLIVPLGEWALRNACTQACAWHKQGGADLRVSVNVSPKQFQSDQSLLRIIETVLAESALPPQLLEIEITEGALMQNAEHAVETLRLLKRLGVSVTIDDFGTGYSSLSYLKRFPIDCLKIDRSFVRDVTTNLDDASICGAVVAMAHNLCMKVVAEGVETREQWHYLKTLGCDEVQGYLVSRPVPALEFEQFLANWRGEYRETNAA